MGVCPACAYASRGQWQRRLRNCTPLPLPKHVASHLTPALQHARVLVRRPRLVCVDDGRPLAARLGHARVRRAVRVCGRVLRPAAVRLPAAAAASPWVRVPDCSPTSPRLPATTPALVTTVRHGSCTPVCLWHCGTRGGSSYGCLGYTTLSTCTTSP